MVSGVFSLSTQVTRTLPNSPPPTPHPGRPSCVPQRPPSPCHWIPLGNSGERVDTTVGDLERQPLLKKSIKTNTAQSIVCPGEGTNIFLFK